MITTSRSDRLGSASGEVIGLAPPAAERRAGHVLAMPINTILLGTVKASISRSAVLGVDFCRN